MTVVVGDPAPDGACPIGEEACKAPPKVSPELFLVQQHFHTSSDLGAGTEEPCLCVFDIDRTLTGRQERLAPRCPRNRLVPGVFDSAYGGGQLTLSALAAEGLSGTFCGACYLGVCSAGPASGAGSEERRHLADNVLVSEPQQRLQRVTPQAKAWSYGSRITSPFVLSQPDRMKHFAVEGIVAWYRGQGINIPSDRVHFFGDRTENIGPFQAKGFNAREISCASRDSDLGGMVGFCGAAPEEIVPELGVKTCDAQGPEGPSSPWLDSSPGRNGRGQPLQVCQGDCDDDSDCATGLMCYQRDGPAAVPGCRGEGVHGFDYCVAERGASPSPPPPPPTPSPTLSPTPPPPPPAGGEEATPLDSSPGRDGRVLLQVCQGDCDRDSDCAGGLRCFQRQGFVPVPGCSGRGIQDFDYCAAPTPSPEPASAPGGARPMLDGSPGHGGAQGPLSECQGSCDQDADCADGLRCLKRASLEPVPECGGANEQGFSYCARAEGSPGPAPLATEPAVAPPTPAPPARALAPRGSDLTSGSPGATGV